MQYFCHGVQEMFLHPFFLDIFQEHVEIQALQDELSQRDAELKALRTDLASAYGKLKDLKDFESPWIWA